MHPMRKRFEVNDFYGNLREEVGYANFKVKMVSVTKKQQTLIHFFFLSFQVGLNEKKI